MEDVTRDKLFIQEIINDLEKRGYVLGGKAYQMLCDWSKEMRDRAPRTRGRVKRMHAEVCGRHNY